VASRGDWIGVSVVQNNGSTSHLSQTQLLDYKLIHLGLEADATDEMVREALAKVCGQIISMARPWNCSLIAMEQGLGKLRASGRNKSLNRKINFWARSVFEQILLRRCQLSSISLESVWAAYSTTPSELIHS
jgi:hypothetical protein